MSDELQRLDPGVDYLFCPECKEHVPCVRTDVGWEVQCPRCIGECGYCGCPLREACIGVSQDTSRAQIPPEAEIPPCPFPVDC